MSMHIGGTPGRPDFEETAALYAIGSRIFGGAFAVAGDMAEAAAEVVGQTAAATRDVGQGAVDTVAQAGEGVVTTVGGLITGDIEKAGKGLIEATVGTVSEAAGALAGAVGSLAEGAADAAAGIGSAGADRWRDAVPARWQDHWARARTNVDAMPHPAIPFSENVIYAHSLPFTKGVSSSSNSPLTVVP